MVKFESRLDLEKLQAALTIVIGNDIIVPHIEQKEAFLTKTMIYGYIWRYKNCSVNVALNSIVDAEILQSNTLHVYVEDIRAYVKSEFCRMLDKEVKSNAM